MAVGNISDSAPKLSPKETYEIGKTLYFEKEYYHCAKWMDATRGLLANSGFAVNTPWYSDILDYESFCYSEAGNIPRALQLTREILTYGVHSDLLRINANADYFAKQIKKRKINPDLPENSSRDLLILILLSEKITKNFVKSDWKTEKFTTMA